MEVTHLKQTMVVLEEVSVESVLSELESISSLKEKQRTTFLHRNDVFNLLPSSFGNSLI